ncbi:MAG: hypothetical protein HND50_10520 [Calditrichaeota bacterium]|nr:hypothetical protein [Calditrichota bacterium]
MISPNKNKYPSGLCFVLILLTTFSITTCSTHTSSPKSDGEYSFVVYGDLRQGFGVYEKLARNMGNIKPVPLMAVCTGDLLFKAGKEAEWINFWKFSKPITEVMPLLIARGNHEGNDLPSEWLLRKQTNIAEGDPFYFSRQLEKQKLIILDTEIRGEENAIINDQLHWLKEELNLSTSNAEIDGIFIFMHRPLYRQGRNKGQKLKNAEELHQLFVEHKKIKAVVAGHDHMYHFQNKDGINYVISGGAGAQLRHGYGGDFYHYIKFSFSDTDKSVNMKTIGLFNEIMEEKNL